MERLSINLNTHALQLKTEKIRQQKLNTKLKKTRSGTTLKHGIVDHLNVKFTQYRERAETNQLLMERMIGFMRTVTHRCPSHIHQLFISTIPHLPLSVEGHLDISQLAYELLQTIDLLRKPENTPMSPSVSQ